MVLTYFGVYYTYINLRKGCKWDIDNFQLIYQTILKQVFSATIFIIIIILFGVPILEGTVTALTEGIVPRTN